MLKSKELRQNKVRLEASARAKLAEIKDDTSASDAKRIEDEHAIILSDIVKLDDQIRAAKKSEDGDDMNDEDHARADDADADTDDDDESDDTKKKKRNAARIKARNAAEAQTRAVMAELVTIDTQARGLGINLNLPDAITRGEQPDEMRKRLFAELAKKSDGGGPRSSSSPDRVEIVRDEAEGRSSAMEIALVTRMLQSRGGHRSVPYAPKNTQELAHVEKHRKQAEQYLGMGLVEIAASCIDYRGHNGQMLTTRHADEILTRAFNSTSDFPSIFQNVLNKALLARYELATPTYRQLGVERNFVDFRNHPQIRAGEFPTLQAVTETGELKYASSADNLENASVLPYGIIFSISRQMLVNDDLSAIDQILGSAGDTVLIFENTTFFNMMLSGSSNGPTLNQDSLTVFHATHGNLAATGVDPSVTSIGAARAAMRAFKSISGLFLNVPPALIVTGPAQETIADQMVASITPTLTTSYNPFSGKLTSVSDANILDNSWYLFADPGRVPNFVYGFLNGANGPRTRTFEPFGVQGVKVSLEHDFGVGAIDYRGAYRTPLH